MSGKKRKVFGLGLHDRGIDGEGGGGACEQGDEQKAEDRG